MCLSKGLGAPIGSVIVGDKRTIELAKQYRKLFGGGWRQAGIGAAAGIYCIQNHWPRLVQLVHNINQWRPNFVHRMKEDHEHARYLYEELKKIGFEVEEPQTNMLHVNSQKLNIQFEEIISEMDSIQKKEGNDGIVLLEGENYYCRIVIHHQITLEGINKLIELLKTIVNGRNNVSN
jgi:threonine aldolase